MICGGVMIVAFDGPVIADGFNARAKGDSSDKLNSRVLSGFRIMLDG